MKAQGLWTHLLAMFSVFSAVTWGRTGGRAEELTVGLKGQRTSPLACQYVPLLYLLISLSLPQPHILTPALSGSSHPWGCPECQTQRAFEDCQGRSTHRCGSSAQSLSCRHHTEHRAIRTGQLPGEEAVAGGRGWVWGGYLTCCGNFLPPPLSPVFIKLTCHGACAQPALAW